MASIKRAHQWQAVGREGVRSMRCRRCGMERLNATGWCYVEEIPDPETPDDKAE